MTAASIDDGWMERALVTIAPIGKSDLHFASLTETVDIDIGGKDFDAIALLNGGRAMKWSPQDVTTVTLEAYPLFAGTSGGSGTAKGFFDLFNGNASTAVPLRIPMDYSRQKLRLSVLWTNDPTVNVVGASANSATTANYSALRFVAAGGSMTKSALAFTDGILKLTATFKFPPFDKVSSNNIIIESCEGASGSDLLPVINSYTTSYKF